MCGIAGIFHYNTERAVDESLLHRMAKLIQHRGPDDDGFYITEKVGLVQRRLAIIDLSPSGHQPMSNEDGSIWITFNGEIYNYQELRRELEQRGHRFASRSDTETIIHAYEEWGASCCTKLRGMFAYALWDEKQQALILARDRLGKKPLVYTQTSSAFLFGSELRVLLQHSEVQREVDLNALYAYLLLFYIPSPLTIFKGIAKLPPAHYLVFRNGETHLERYWRVDYSHKWVASEEEYSERLWELLQEAVRIRLMSEVPLGAFLSGGIDSSAVVGVMSRLMNEPVKTFSIRYEESGFDETPYARQIAHLFQTEHHEFTVRPKAIEVLPRLVWHYGEPFADASALPTYYVSEMTRQYVTVALSGDAGDETFAGYRRYQAAYLIALYQRVPKALRYWVQGILVEMIGKRLLPAHLYYLIKIITERGDLSAAEGYFHRTPVFSAGMAAALLEPQVFDQIDRRVVTARLEQHLAEFGNGNVLDRELFLDLMCYLPDDILVKVDIASMANSLEVRAPFLDHLLVEFAASLPPEMKRKNLTTKYILKQTLRRLLPAEILSRPKHGFSVPISRWLREELKVPLVNLLLDQRSLQRGYFKPQTIRTLIDEHLQGKMDHGDRLWALLNLELWQRTYMDVVAETPISW